MTTKTYHVSDPIAFRALSFPLPPNSLVFWSQGSAGGVLMLPGVNYLATGGLMVIAFPVAQGDTVTVVTFP